MSTIILEPRNESLHLTVSSDTVEDRTLPVVIDKKGAARSVQRWHAHKPEKDGDSDYQDKATGAGWPKEVSAHQMKYLRKPIQPCLE
jgi:hypothetical protein